MYSKEELEIFSMSVECGMFVLYRRLKDCERVWSVDEAKWLERKGEGKVDMGNEMRLNLSVTGCR